MNNTRAVGTTSHRCGLIINSNCEVFAKISINGKEEFRTAIKTVDETNWGTFYEEFNSKKIRKSEQIKVELMADNISNDDKLLIRQQLDIVNIVGKFGISANANSVSMITTWQDEYQD